MTTSSDTRVEDRLKTILVEDLFCEVPIDQIDPDDGLQEVLGLDSLGFVELRAQCEQQFGVTIAEADFTPAHFRSVRTVSRLVLSLRGAADV